MKIKLVSEKDVLSRKPYTFSHQVKDKVVMCKLDKKKKADILARKIVRIDSLVVFTDEDAVFA